MDFILKFFDKNYRYIYVILLFIFIILLNLPLINLSFEQDEIDILYHISAIKNVSELFSFLFAHHNEHLSFLTYFIYFVLYKIWGMNIIPFSTLGLSIHFMSSLLILRIIYNSTDDYLLSMIGAMIFAISNISLFLQWKIVALQLGLSNLFILSIIFLLNKFSLHSCKIKLQYRYTILLLLSIFSFGTMGTSVIIFVLIPAFYYSFLKNDEKVNIKKARNNSTTILIGSILGLILWFIKGTNWIFQKHYITFGKSSLFESFNLFGGILFSFLAFIKLFLKIYNIPLSILLIIIMIFSIIKYYKKIDYKKCMFSVLFIISAFFIVFAFRYDWKDSYLWSRYYLIPSAGYSFLFIYLTRDSFILLARKRKHIFLLILSLLFIIQIFLGVRQNINIADYYYINNYDRLEKFKTEYFALAEKFNKELLLKDTTIQITKSENIKQFSQYIRIITKGNNNIIWAEQTDEQLRLYLKSNRNSFPIFSQFINLEIIP